MYTGELGKIASYDGCNVFKKTLNKIRQEKHEIPGKALLDTVKYLMNNFGKSPTANMDYYKKKIEFLRKSISRNERKLNRRISKSKRRRLLNENSIFNRQIFEFERKLNSKKIAISNYQINSKWNRMFTIDLSNLDDIKIDASKVSHGAGNYKEYSSSKNFNSKLVHCVNKTEAYRKLQRINKRRRRRGKSERRLSERNEKSRS